jgi:hypothetical protein
MKNLFLLVLLGCLFMKTAAASEGTLPKTALGWTGSAGDLSGIPMQITDTWTARSSWTDLESVGWPGSNKALQAYVKANPNAAVDFATGLIPHALPSSEWNGLLDEVVAGEHDDVFVQEGKNMAKWGSNIIYCRPWWEMTMSVTNLDATKFKAAWNHAIPIIRSSFAAAAPTKTLKIAYCYLPSAQGDPKAYFPGPQNVDVIDADIYGEVWGSRTPSQEAMLASIQNELDYLAEFAATYNKPVGVSEWGNVAIKTQGTTDTQGRGDDPQYINLMLSYGIQHDFLYMVYFDISSGGPNETFANTPLSLAAFRAVLTTARPSATSTTTSSTTPSAASTTTSSTTPSATSTTTSSSTPSDTSTTPSSSTPSDTSTTTSSSTPSDTSTTTSSSTPSDTSTTASTTYAGWQAKYFDQTQLADPTVSGPTADPYGSGIPNLLAYAFQLDPAAAQQSDLPQPEVKNGHLAMSYQVPSAITDVNFVPEVSADLQTWNSTSAAVQVVSNTVNATGTTIAVVDCLPTTTKTHFMRLRVVWLQ